MTRFLKVAALTVAALLAGLARGAEPSVELRAYPAGAILSAGLHWPLDARSEWGASLLYNRAERGDAGEHEDESGDGFGIGMEARRFHRSSRSGWFTGVRAELFQLEIDWRDPGRRGESEITVLQPTAQLGYRFAALRPGLSLELAASGGAEINLETDGEEVGEGAIGLFGVALRFQ